MQELVQIEEACFKPLKEAHLGLPNDHHTTALDT